MMNQISSDPEANVTMQYDEVTDRFVMSAKQLGTGSNIQLSENGSTFLAAAGLDVPDYTAGKDASIVLDGTQTIVRGSNSFTINGVTYSLHKKSGTTQTISLEQDAQSIYDNIKKFVDKYNEVAATINKELGEKYDRNYLPLTDEQKESMDEKEIEKWEDRAKTGLLRNDSMLQNIVQNMRRALNDGISGVSTSLSNIGITTGSYDEKGKLIINEDKLKAAIDSNPDGVMELFTKKSDVATNINLTPEQRTKRYNEEGLAYRLFDVIENNIRTIRDEDGNKGLLLEKAGIDGDLSDIKNTLYNEIKEFNEDIFELTNKLYKREESYYQKYARLEKMLASMMDQGNYLMNQFTQQ
jgi:flagellar hook-associated protein 2